MTTRQLLSALIAIAVATAALQPVHGRSVQDASPSFGVDATVAELRLNDNLLTALHRTSGRTPRPGEDWVTVHDLNGVEVARVVPSGAIPDAQMVNVQEAVAAHGILIVSVYVSSAAGQHANLLLRYDLPSGSLRRVTRTDPTVCWYLAVDATSSWCLGGDAETFEQSSKNFDLLYRFSHDGVLQESALNWLQEFPDVSYPVTISRAGTPSLVAVNGGVRAWFPKAGRTVTWRPGHALRVTPLPPELLSQLDSRGNRVTDVGPGMVITVTTATPDRAEQKVTLWRESSGVTVSTATTFSADTRVVGSRATQLLLWDRAGQRLSWQEANWLK